jgi:hypothetical protein
MLRRFFDFYFFKKNNFNRILNEEKRVTFAFFSANINIFLPHINYKNYKNILIKIIYNNNLAIKEKKNYKNSNKIDHSSLDVPKNKGFFIVSYHYGSYHLITTMLIKLNLKTIVCVNNNVLIDTNSKKDIEENLEQVNILKKEKDNKCDLKFLSVQDELFVYKIKDYLNENYVVLIFIDGNSGLDGIMNFENKHKTEIKFLGQLIKVKYGIPSLAFSFNVPIIPVFLLRNRNKFILKTTEHIYPDKLKSKEDFSIYAIAKIYKELEKQLLIDPFQWEGWLYIHRWLKVESLNDKEIKFKNTSNNINKLEFNNEKFEFFTLKGNNFILNKNTHLSYEIDDNLKEIIFNKNKRELNKELIEECIKNNILI